MKLIISTILLLSMTIAQTSAAENASLISTYQREIAFLSAQKRNFQKQQKQIEKDYVSKTIKAEKDLKRLQKKLVTLTKENESLGQTLTISQRALDNIDSANSLVQTTLSQAKLTLDIEDKKWDELEKIEQKALFAFESAGAKLQKSSAIYTNDEEFFNRAGKKVKGKVLHFGSIASFGTTDARGSNLIPVGLGNMKMDEVDMSSALNKLENNEQLDSLRVFLYENTSKGIEVRKDKTFMQMLSAGGSIAYVIAVLGALAMFLVILRGALLYKASRYDQEVIENVKNGEINNVGIAVKLRKTPIDRVLNNTYEARSFERESRETIIHESILSELNYLDKFGAIILVMAAVAPLLGLLGTVTGMISTFDIITEFGTGDPKLLSSGISEALITTKLGLIVAIPSLLLGNLLGGWSSKIKLMLEREALRLSNFIEKNKEAHV